MVTRVVLKRFALAFLDKYSPSLTFQFHLDIQEGQLIEGLKPGMNGYGREPSERYGQYLPGPLAEPN